MKRTSELTETELLALSGEDFSRQIDFECAHQGIPMLPPNPGPAPTNNLPAPDTKVYMVAGITTEDADLAGQILQIVTSGRLVKTEYLRGYDGPKYLKTLKEGDYAYPEIKTETCYSEQLWAEMKEERERFEVAKKQWEANMRPYNEALEGRQGIVDELNDRINEACHKKYEMDQLTSDFERYLELAENNSTVAMNFLLKAKPKAAEKYPLLIQELCPGYGIEPENTAA